MKKLMTATLMVLALQSPAMATYGLSSGVSVEDMEKGMLYMSAMCRRDAPQTNNGANLANLNTKKVVSEMWTIIPAKYKTDTNKNALKDYVSALYHMYMACMMGMPNN